MNMLGVLSTILHTQSIAAKKLLGRIEELSIFVNITGQEMHFKPKFFNPYHVFFLFHY